ncbi:unnamed protein product [Closterium sp. NIES-53]
MAAQELRWLTYLLTNLAEQARSPPVLYVDNKAMIAMCQDTPPTPPRQIRAPGSCCQKTISDDVIVDIHFSCQLAPPVRHGESVLTAVKLVADATVPETQDPEAEEQEEQEAQEVQEAKEEQEAQEAQEAVVALVVLVGYGSTTRQRLL